MGQKIQFNNETLTLLHNINLDIQQGQSVAIVGPSGAGKSTLLGILAGLDVPSQGEIYLENEKVSHMDEEQRANARSRYVSFVFQNFQLLSSLTALENVMLPLEVQNKPSAEQTARKYLERVGLKDRIHHRPTELSGGEQQRVAIARAFACEAPIIFADEPTGNLDTRTGESILKLLFELNKDTNTTLVIVTHSKQLADQCQRRLEMNAGALSEQHTNSISKT